MTHISFICKRPGPERPRAGRARLWPAALLLCLAAVSAPALSLEELVADPRLTPEGLLRQLAGFRFRLGRTVQAPAAFLACQAGDCDDFARLAAEVLGRKGYTPRLVVVQMEREAHVVCHVKEIDGYLDYNRRREGHPVVACAGELTEVADKVAASLRARWRTASEFVYETGRPKFLRTAFH